MKIKITVNFTQGNNPQEVFEFETSTRWDEVQKQIRERFKLDQYQPIELIQNGYTLRKLGTECIGHILSPGHTEATFTLYKIEKKPSFQMDLAPAPLRPISEADIKVVYPHYTMTISEGRSHRYPAKMQGEELTGDALKSKLLKEFVMELNSVTNGDELVDTYAKIKKSPKYSILKKPQDWTSDFFKIKTDSCKALSKLYHAKLNEFVIIGNETDTPKSPTGRPVTPPGYTTPR